MPCIYIGHLAQASTPQTRTHVRRGFVEQNRVTPNTYLIIEVGGPFGPFRVRAGLTGPFARDYWSLVFFPGIRKPFKTKSPPAATTELFDQSTFNSKWYILLRFLAARIFYLGVALKTADNSQDWGKVIREQSACRPLPTW